MSNTVERSVPSVAYWRGFLVAGVANILASAAVFVHLRRTWTAWEPDVDIASRCGLALAAVVAGLLARAVARRDDSRSLALVFAAATTLVVTLVPAGANGETLAWIAAAIVGSVLIHGSESVHGSIPEFVPAVHLEPGLDATEIESSPTGFEPEPELGLFEDPEAGIVSASERAVVDGCDTASGRCRIEFFPGQRIATLHVPFVPAFDHVPDCEVELADGEGSPKVTATRAYGTRVEIRRSDITSRASVTLLWSAWAAADRRAGAA